MKTWQLQEAKSHLSQLVREAMNGPQQITVHGAPAVIVLNKAAFDQLTCHKSSFVTWIRQSPWVGVELDLQRDQELTRDEDFEV